MARGNVHAAAEASYLRARRRFIDLAEDGGEAKANAFLDMRAAWRALGERTQDRLIGSLIDWPEATQVAKAAAGR